jgi:hypothetical protein
MMETLIPDDRYTIHHCMIMNNDLEKIWKEAAVALTVPANLFNSLDSREGELL